MNNMAQFVKNNTNSHGARSKTRAPQRDETGGKQKRGKKNYQYQSSSTESRDSWSVVKNKTSRDSTNDNWGDIPNAPSAWDGSAKWDAVGNTNSHANSWQEQQSRGRNNKSKSLWDDIDQDFPSLDTNKPNFWEERQRKFEDAKSLAPTSKNEEQAMLEKALRMSEMTMKENQRRRNLEEEYLTQQQMLLENPEQFKEFLLPEEPLVENSFSSSHLPSAVLEYATSVGDWNEGQYAAGLKKNSGPSFVPHTSSVWGSYEDPIVHNNQYDSKPTSSHKSSDNWGDYEEPALKKNRSALKSASSCQNSDSYGGHKAAPKKTFNSAYESSGFGGDYDDSAAEKSQNEVTSNYKSSDNCKDHSEESTEAIQTFAKSSANYKDHQSNRHTEPERSQDRKYAKPVEKAVQKSVYKVDAEREKSKISKVVDMFGGWGSSSSSSRTYDVPNVSKANSKQISSIANRTNSSQSKISPNASSGIVNKTSHFVKVSEDSKPENPVISQSANVGSDSSFNKVESAEYCFSKEETANQSNIETFHIVENMKTCSFTNEVNILHQTEESDGKLMSTHPVPTDLSGTSREKPAVVSVSNDAQKLAFENDSYDVPITVSLFSNPNTGFQSSDSLSTNTENLPKFNSIGNNPNVPVNTIRNADVDTTINAPEAVSAFQPLEPITPPEPVPIFPSTEPPKPLPIFQSTESIEPPKPAPEFLRFQPGMNDNLPQSFNTTVPSSTTLPDEPVNVPPLYNPMPSGFMNPNLMSGMNPNLMGGMTPNIMGGMNPNLMGGINPNLMGSMNPNLMGGMNPVLMQQMLMLSNPFLAQEILAMEMYYRSLGLSTGLPPMFLPQIPVMPNQNEPAFTNPTRSYSNSGPDPNNGHTIINPPTYNFTEAAGSQKTDNTSSEQPSGFVFPDMPQGALNPEDGNSLLMSFLADKEQSDNNGLFIQPPVLPSNSGSQAPIDTAPPVEVPYINCDSKPSGAMNFNNNISDSVGCTTWSNNSSAETSQSIGWGDLDVKSSVKTNFSNDTDGWGDENSAAQSMGSPLRFDTKKKSTYRQPASQPNFSRYKKPNSYN